MRIFNTVRLYRTRGSTVEYFEKQRICYDVTVTSMGYYEVNIPAYSWLD